MRNTKLYIDSLDAQLQIIQRITELVKLDLDDDARIEDLQYRYKDEACDTLAKALLMRINIKKLIGDDLMIYKSERICDAAEALYRMVK